MLKGLQHLANALDYTVEMTPYSDNTMYARRHLQAFREIEAELRSDMKQNKEQKPQLQQTPCSKLREELELLLKKQEEVRISNLGNFEGRKAALNMHCIQVTLMLMDEMSPVA